LSLSCVFRATSDDFGLVVECESHSSPLSNPIFAKISMEKRTRCSFQLSIICPLHVTENRSFCEPRSSLTTL
jgi:hypothetical protein